ncbi:putative C6 finger domain protein [Aspergillus clavatus NRRL 1]|uniref:C6 finger domain protein, putative n=1 Tax=Aspergillus clavatus (strain ATCC 1007 / CBS 513.65 / DSM 816 / NCTC 3887 / NRRL 1 / QM 1276 / 107) TaxID=344612 RepID=A1C7V3_ASPCL|nr:C6 finger domain protein, putative [Aspergillus clavatus NRRL 1]EAW14474.1 C6 finger domain protein, putative [Aspergillus clavatus NRRL 1]
MQAIHQERPSVHGEPPVYTEPVSQDHPHQVPVPKNVAFELLLDENSRVRARIPMRVQIYPHDTTDSIVTTVKNFYGIYDGAASGVSFEDESGITLIARYENLRNNMTVYVRVIPVQAYSEDYGDRYYGIPGEGRKRPSLGEPFQLTPAAQPAQLLEHTNQPPSRPTSRLARKRSTSPSGRSRRSASQNKQLSRAGNKSRGSSTHGSFHDDGASGYSDSEGGYGSVSGTKKSRSEQFGSSDISMENILHDGRRKRPKFESSELPLFVPPQVPLTTSTSSISPQRRSVGQEGAISPFARPNQRPYNYQQPLPSPQSYRHNDQAYTMSSAQNVIYATPMVPEHGHRLRDRTAVPSSGQYSSSASRAGAPGVLPTPDPTIASCISDEDVAMQLIRLGDASNFSHGRTSASTLDDAFSGAADAASSTGATSEGEDFSEDDDDLPARNRQKLESSPMLPPGTTKRTHKRLDDILPSFDSSDGSYDGMDEDYQQEELNDTLVKSEVDEDSLYAETTPKPKKAKIRSTSIASAKSRVVNKTAPSRQNKVGKPASSAVPRKAKSTVAMGNQKAPPPPQMVSPAPTRKTSTSSINGQHPLAADEEDLSTKPRCQRCRKSKKGCDRQRPCGRCKDAGIGLDGCISEDEGNGRKGRYGRHMGVPVKKSLDGVPVSSEPPSTITTLISASALAEKNKKRKR